MQRFSLRVTVAWTLIFLVPGQAMACPFCSAVSQTLRQEMKAMDAIAIASMVPGSETDSAAEFRIESVLQGTGIVEQEQAITINFYGKPKEDQRFLVMGLSPPDVIWSTPLPLSETAENYVKKITELPTDDEASLERLEFYMDYLEHEESLLARDAYDEFASAPYSQIIALKPRMDREQLIAWVKDTSLPPERKRLYLVMLGVCGQESDADLLEEILRSDDADRRGGLDAMIACYITLKKEAGMGLIDELFLKNEDSPYVDTYAAIMALRFHGTEGGIVKKKRVLESMRLVLERPELADLVIPDLARWEDWTQVDKLVELFKKADKKSTWVRVPVINYLRACPLPEADEVIEELKEIDPGAYKRATSFFPLPQAADQEKVSYQLKPLQPNPLMPAKPLVPAKSLQIAMAAEKADVSRIPVGVSNVTGASMASQAVQPSSSNQASAAVVILMASTTLALSMWLTISGAGQ